MKDTVVIKIGGSTFGSGDTTIEDIVAVQKEGVPLVVVHGGGSTVTSWLKKQDIPTTFVRGERVTDAPALEVVTAVLAGLVNKQIAAAVNCGGGKAVGISGADGGIIQSRIRDSRMGYVGSVEQVDPELLETLLAAGYVPVVSPISLLAVDRPANAPPVINVNGDPVAGEIAAALGAARLAFLTDVPGISGADGKAIERLSAAQAEALVTSGVASGGMIPKINACLKALEAGTVTRIIDGRPPHALLDEIAGRGAGTTIYK